MPRAYFIGGAPRVGKTLLALRIVKRRPMFVLSADAVRDMLRGILKPADSPALFTVQRLAKNESALAALLRNSPQLGIQLQNEESAVVWPSVNELVLSYLTEGQDVLVEGVEILPAMLCQVTYPYRAVFLGNTSPAHASAIATHARAHPHDWMHNYAPETVQAWAALTRSFSEYVRFEATKHDLPYYETNDDDFEQSMRHAQHLLLGGDPN